MRPARLGVRLRIALLFCALVLGVGAVLLGSVQALLSHLVAGPSAQVSSNTASGSPAPSSVAGGNATLTPGQLAEAQELKRLLGEQARRLSEDFRQATVRPMARRSLVLWVCLVPLALWLGWVASGRAVRPFAEITTAARRISGRKAGERLAVQGPQDEIRELADTFDDMLARLEEAENGQWRFVVNASHELKTPLAINRTLIEVALGRPDCPSQMTQLGETLLEVNTRHERLINGLLTLANSEHAVVRPVPLDLREVVQRACDMALSEARAAGVSVTVQGGVVPMQGDPTLLERLVLNLLQNGIRYNVPQGWVRAECEATTGGARLTVTNSGHQIPPHELSGIFEPFRRLQDRVGSTQGSGLGLAIVRSVARAHGGEVTADARPDGGLVVTVAVPAPRQVPRGE